MKIATIDNHDTRPEAGTPAAAIPSLLRLYSRLGRLPRAKLELVARKSECQLVPAGNALFRQEDDADAIYMLLDGEITLEHRDSDGRAATHRLFGPRTSFGDLGLLGETTRYYTANATSDSVVVRTPLSLIRAILAANPDIAQAWIQAVSSHMQRRERNLAGSIRQRVANPEFFDAA